MLSPAEKEAIHVLAKAGVKRLHVDQDFYARFTEHVAREIDKMTPPKLTPNPARFKRPETILRERLGDRYWMHGVDVRLAKGHRRKKHARKKKAT